MVTRDDALKICETVLEHAKAAGADDAQVSLDNSVESHARFADNRITTSGRADDVDITATVWVGRRRGAATVNDSAPPRSSRSRPTPCRSRAYRRCSASTCRRSDPLTTPRVAGSRRQPPTSMSPRAPRPCRRSSTCAAAKMTGAGFHTARASATATATANGNRRYFRSTRADLSVTARSADGTGSGYYSGDHFDLAASTRSASRARP